MWICKHCKFTYLFWISHPWFWSFMFQTYPYDYIKAFLPTSPTPASKLGSLVGVVGLPTLGLRLDSRQGHYFDLVFQSQPNWIILWDVLPAPKTWTLLWYPLLNFNPNCLEPLGYHGGLLVRHLLTQCKGCGFKSHSSKVPSLQNKVLNTYRCKGNNKLWNFLLCILFIGFLASTVSKFTLTQILDFTTTINISNEMRNTDCLPECVCWDGHDSFGALLRGKPRRILQCLVGQRGQVETRLVPITKPRSARHGKNLRTDHKSKTQFSSNILVRNHFFFKTTLLQREPFLTMLNTIDSSPLPCQHSFWVITNSVHCLKATYWFRALHLDPEQLDGSGT